MTLTGPEDAVDGYLASVQSMEPDAVTVIGERRLGRTKAVMLYGAANDAQRGRARAAGLDIDPLELQELFIHLTARNGDKQ